LFQYAWEGGEPALWETRSKLKELGSWKQRVDWAWKSFGKASMEVSHKIVVSALKRSDCTQIKFEEFSNNYDETIRKWLRVWDVEESTYPKLIQLAASQDVNRLTPEQRESHNHMSGFTLSKDDHKQIEQAFNENSDLIESLTRERKELGYS